MKSEITSNAGTVGKIMSASGNLPFLASVAITVLALFRLLGFTRQTLPQYIGLSRLPLRRIRAENGVRIRQFIVALYAFQGACATQAPKTPKTPNTLNVFGVLGRMFWADVFGGEEKMA